MNAELELGVGMEYESKHDPKIDLGPRTHATHRGIHNNYWVAPKDPEIAATES